MSNEIPAEGLTYEQVELLRAFSRLNARGRGFALAYVRGLEGIYPLQKKAKVYSLPSRLVAKQD